MRPAVSLIAATLLLAGCSDKPADHGAVDENMMANAEEVPANEVPVEPDNVNGSDDPQGDRSGNGSEISGG